MLPVLHDHLQAAPLPHLRQCSLLRMLHRQSQRIKVPLDTTKGLRHLLPGVPKARRQNQEIENPRHPEHPLRLPVAQANSQDGGARAYEIVEGAGRRGRGSSATRGAGAAAEAALGGGWPTGGQKAAAAVVAAADNRGQSQAVGEDSSDRLKWEGVRRSRTSRISCWAPRFG